MKSPPAIPFFAPDNKNEPNSLQSQSIHIDMGGLASFCVLPLEQQQYNNASTTIISLRGLLVPPGVTLIVGGGYHGKSTLLQTLASGVYNKIPGDGREYCVSLANAVTVRAEDGRYVNRTNISAFLNQLPFSPKSATPNQKQGDRNSVSVTQQFTTQNASGSTSQATNVINAIFDLSSPLLLIDEDVSAANFMARDGRMRALIQNESITPLLYRINGIYTKLGVSSVVVVGGVGDWLDVPHQVIMLDHYNVQDVTKKAQSVSKQFSHGHVQYAGRGVVHRLQWKDYDDYDGTDDGGRITPRPRCIRNVHDFLPPIDGDRALYADDHYLRIQLNHGNTLRLEPAIRRSSVKEVADHNSTVAKATNDCDDNNSYDGNDSEMSIDDNDSDDDEKGEIDMTKCEQLLGRSPQLYGIGLCVAWVLHQVRLSHSVSDLPKSMMDLLQEMKETMDVGGGIQAMIPPSIKQSSTTTNNSKGHHSNSQPVTTTGPALQQQQQQKYAIRPRKEEVGMALLRMRGLQFEELPPQPQLPEEEDANREAETQKQILADLWNNRRKK